MHTKTAEGRGLSKIQVGAPDFPIVGFFVPAAHDLYGRVTLANKTPTSSEIVRAAYLYAESDSRPPLSKRSKVQLKNTSIMNSAKNSRGVSRARSSGKSKITIR